MSRESIWNLLKSVAEGSTTPRAAFDSVLQQIRSTTSSEPAAEETANLTPGPSNPAVVVDLDRQNRCGFPEVVYAPGKDLESIQMVLESQRQSGQHSLVTRCSPEQLTGLAARFPAGIVNSLAKTFRTASDMPSRGRVVVVTAGTSDRPIAEEACETLRWMGVDAELVMDVGVAGPQRLLERRGQLTGSDAVIVVAGMEGALPSVVAGWVGVPVIGVPTSVGYGASFGGVSALLSMLNSCAANVCVVNIDAGFKAGYIAGMIALQSQWAGGFDNSPRPDTCNPLSG